MQPSTKGSIFITVGVVVAILSAVFMGCFGLIFNAILNNMLVIDPDAKIFDTYTAPTVPIYLDFYFFNVTNPEDVMNGEKAILVEIGPYRYLEQGVKGDIVFDHSKGTISYRENTTYFFVPEESIGTEDDLITTINPVMVIVGALTYQNKFMERFFWGDIMEAMNLFENHTVGELLFYGYELPEFEFNHIFTDETKNYSGPIYDILCLVGEAYCIPALEPNRFGYYYGKNGTNDGLYEVNTGEKGMDEYLYIQEWENRGKLSYWDGKYCNMINGTDGTQFPPGVKKEDVLYLFTTDLCRSMYLEFTYNVVVQEYLDCLHYVPPKEVLASGDSNPDNECFCISVPGDVPGDDPADPCIRDSLLNVAPCFGGAPVILSTPHFYQGDEYDVNNVIGLNPQKDLHETFLDIEPTLGVVMQAAKRIQMNLPLRKYGSLPTFQNFTDTIFPIFWANENAVIPYDDAKSVKKVLTVPYLVVYIVFGIILAVAVSSTIYGCLLHQKSRKMKKQGKVVQYSDYMPTR